MGLQAGAIRPVHIRTELRCPHPGCPNHKYTFVLYLWQRLDLFRDAPVWSPRAIALQVNTHPLRMSR